MALITRSCPEDRTAIERVRRFADSWLAGEAPLPTSDVTIEDVLTTTAALMAGIDRDVGGTIPEDDERCAIGAAAFA